MIIARSYSVLDMVVVEVSCVHSADPAGSHLIVREERRGLSGHPWPVLKALGDVCYLASIRDAGEAFRLGLMEPCDLG